MLPFLKVSFRSLMWWMLWLGLYYKAFTFFINSISLSSMIFTQTLLKCPNFPFVEVLLHWLKFQWAFQLVSSAKRGIFQSVVLIPQCGWQNLPSHWVWYSLGDWAINRGSWLKAIWATCVLNSQEPKQQKGVSRNLEVASAQQELQMIWPSSNPSIKLGPDM